MKNSEAAGFASLAAQRASLSPGDWLQAVARWSTIQPESTPGQELDWGLLASSGLNVASGAEGGFLVPPAFASAVWSEVAQSPGSLLGLCDVYPIEGESLTLPAAAGTSLALGSLHGGVTAYRVGEGAQSTASKPTLRALRLAPDGIIVKIVCTDKLVESGGAALAKFLRKAAGDALSQRVNYELVNGTGAGMMKGVLASGCTVSVAKEAGQAAATFLYENASKMWARLLPASKLKAVWLMNPAAEPQLDQFAVGVGPANQFQYRPAETGAASPYPTLKGRPVIWCDACAALGTVGDIILADLSAYCVGVPASGIEQAASMHVRFDYAETAFRFTLPIDGQPWLASAITPAAGTDTLSTFVTVATRA